MKRVILMSILGLGLAFGAYWYSVGTLSSQSVSADSGITIPEQSAAAKPGERLFAENCAVCHGSHGSGTDSGPPLIHIIYEPSHHGDASFQRAVLNGVRQHHWRFGNMPAIDGVDEAEVAKIVTYIREIQRANGIE